VAGLGTNSLRNQYIRIFISAFFGIVGGNPGRSPGTSAVATLIVDNQMICKAVLLLNTNSKGLTRDRMPTHGHAETREAAMSAFSLRAGGASKSPSVWR
jgi:hypothetical protein